MSALEIHGNSQTMNLDSVLLNSIRSSLYFKALGSTRSFPEVIDEISSNVDYLAPYIPNTKMASAAYCILFKFFLMKLTEQQMLTLLEHNDSPYIRALGLLYLRYCHTPSKLWEWYEAYLDDQELVSTHPKHSQITVSKLIIHLLTESKLEDSLLPRIPVVDKKLIDSKLQQFQKKKGEDYNTHNQKNDVNRDRYNDYRGNSENRSYRDNYNERRNFENDKPLYDDRYNSNDRYKDRYYNERDDRSYRDNRDNRDNRYNRYDRSYRDNRVRYDNNNNNNSNRYDRDRYNDRDDDRYHSKDYRDRYNNNDQNYSKKRSRSRSKSRSRSRSNERYKKVDNENSTTDSIPTKKVESETLKKLRSQYNAKSDEYVENNTYSDY